MKALNICIILPILLAACTGRPVTNENVPAWVKGEHSQYPEDSFLTGRGQHKYLKHAKKLARDSILDKLSITLNSQDSQFIYSSRRYVTGTNEINSESMIVDDWKNQVTEEHHVLAVISRKTAADLLALELRRLDDKTRSVIEKTTVARTDLEKVSLAYQALEIQLKRTATEKALYKAHPGSTAIPYVWAQNKLGNDFKKLLSRLRIKPLVILDETSTLNKALRDGFRHANIGIDNTRSPDYLLEASLVINNKNLKIKRGYVSKGNITINMRDNQGVHKGSYTWPLRIESDNPDNTNKVLAEHLSELFKNELLLRLLGFANTDFTYKDRI